MKKRQSAETALVAENARLLAALKEAEIVLALMEHTPPLDLPNYDAVDALGAAIGYGALMSSAERAWRDKLTSTNMPAGGEHVAGPCRSTVESCLANIRAALPQQNGRA